MQMGPNNAGTSLETAAAPGPHDPGRYGANQPDMHSVSYDPTPEPKREAPAQEL